MVLAIKYRSFLQIVPSSNSVNSQPGGNILNLLAASAWTRGVSPVGALRQSSALTRTKHRSTKPQRKCLEYIIWFHMGMDQYLLIPFLVGWTSIYQLFWCELQGYKVLTHCHMPLSIVVCQGWQNTVWNHHFLSFVPEFSEVQVRDLGIAWRAINNHKTCSPQIWEFNRWLGVGQLTAGKSFNPLMNHHFPP